MDESALKKQIMQVLTRLLKMNAISTPMNIFNLLKSKIAEETEKNNKIAAHQLELILQNFEYAKEKELPVCQDTGMINIIVQFSTEFQFFPGFEELLKAGISAATREIPLRPNTVDPFTGKNHSDNLGYNTPPIYYEFCPDIEFLRLIVLNKGGGAENMSELLMLNPSVDLSEVEGKIVNIVEKSGGKPCPPVILGIGIGGDATNCMYLAKKALTRPLFDRHNREEVKIFEENLLKKINNLSVGVMGLGGSFTCLDVRAEYALRHPASFPVGVIVQCYCHRICSAEIKRNLEVFYSHE